MTEATREVYAGADLHGSNVVLSICDGNGTRMMEQRVQAKLGSVLTALEPYREQLKELSVESTYNWYWFVDGLSDADVPVVMASPSRLVSYNGVKETNDFTDARWLAELSRLGVVPQSYVYPRGPRAIRDVLRRRRFLVRQNTAGLNSLAAWRARHAIPPSESGSIQDVAKLGLDPFVCLEAQILLKAIDQQRHLIKRIERNVLEVIKPFRGYEQLLQIHGIGTILAMTIYLETGELSRFASSANYASYCRTVRSRRTSNTKSKGRNNARNGNPHLGWAFSEAATFAIRYDERAKRWFERKRKRTNAPVAYKSLASKLSKAAWHVMHGDVYEPERLFK